MDGDKLGAVQVWSRPHAVKDLQHFLSFSNFYRWFIKSFSSIASPLKDLLRTWGSKPSWMPEEESPQGPVLLYPGSAPAYLIAASPCRALVPEILPIR